MSHETVVHINVDLTIDGDVRIPVGSVSEVIESEDYRSIGRVLKGNHARCHMAVLNLVEYIYPKRISNE